MMPKLRELHPDDLYEVLKDGESIGTARRSDVPVLGLVSQALGPNAEPGDFLIQPMVNGGSLHSGQEVVILPLYRWENEK